MKMKTLLLKIGILTILLFGGSYEETFAASDWANKCVSFGDIRKDKNPPFQHINCLLTNAALAADIPPEIVKAVAFQESHWQQYKDGKVNIASDGGIGIMQITTIPSAYKDRNRLKNDILYNIEAGVFILANKYNYVNSYGEKIPKIKGASKKEIENWYFPVMAYNGTKAVNAPIYQKNGLTNTGAYQEKVFTKMKAESFLNAVSFAKFPFKVENFLYDSNHNIEFKKIEYTLTDALHTSNHLLKKGDLVIVTGGEGNLREGPSTSGIANKLALKSTILEITGTFAFDKNIESKNQFVWLPVKTLDGKSKGFIASAYVRKHIDKTAPPLPVVNTVSDKSTVITGKAEKNAMVYAKVGSKEIGRATALNGAYSINISKQKAGTTIAVYAVDRSGNQSASKTVKVIDKTAPAAPTVNKISSKTSIVTGKGEKGALIFIYNGKNKIGQGSVDSNGNYKVKIKVQKKGSALTIYAQDKAGNKSSSKTLKVS